MRTQWSAGSRPEKTDLQVKLRHGAAFHACTLTWEDDRCLVKLATRDQGIAPGQFAVFYDGEYCLGAGIIAIS
jgi:tRNA-specific 2-thiouridylase